MAEYNLSNISLPPLFINGYIKEQLVNFGLVPDNPDWTPIVPVLPTSIETLYKQLVEKSGESSPILIQYDKLIRFRSGVFYRKKREQLIYTIICSSYDKKEMASRIIIEALDREDSSAQDINFWSSNNTLLDDGKEIPKNVYFHNTKIYQIDESRDLIELSSMKTNFWDKIIIEYDYHTIDNFSSGINTNPYT